ncbi:MAG: hypothetical protein G01um101420_794 [Parcubacteria group bacterium Gr01-1014_20]|nr:MAG: hypothetical protein G01um101420_794 [Parcubacteria group bacterium Gr01-1014_20]
MSSVVSREQALQLMSVLSSNASWSDLSPGTVQRIIDNPRRAGEQFTKFLGGGGFVIKNSIAGITSPAGGVVLSIPIWVNESSPWDRALKECHTPLHTRAYLGESWIWKVGDHYKPEPLSSFKVITLVNFGSDLNSSDVLGWAYQQNLRPTTPRTCFAIGREYSSLADDLYLKRMIIVTLTPCPLENTIRVPGLWLETRSKGARLPSYETHWTFDHWFAFELTTKSD